MTPDRPLFAKRDEIYGEMVFSLEEQRIINTPQIQRLEDISLSAVPPMTLGKQIPSRLEHSLGVAHLAKIVGQKLEFSNYSKELFAAAISHDVGSPPFSHLGERYLHKVFGISHEQFAQAMISNSELEKEFVAQGINPNIVIKMINGQLKPVGDVVAGSIDVDNLDNIQRYGKAMKIIDAPLYSGERVARGYTLRDNEIVLQEGLQQDVEGWLESRNRVYKYVYGVNNQTMGAMTSRALYFAFEKGELPKEFFFWTDTKAYDYLIQDCNPRTKRIAAIAAEKQPYIPVTDLLTTEPTEKLIQLCKDSDNRDKMADELAARFNIPREDICIYFGKSRNFRKVQLHVINNQNPVNRNGIKQEWTAQVFVHPEQQVKFDRIDGVFRSQIGFENE